MIFRRTASSSFHKRFLAGALTMLTLTSSAAFAEGLSMSAKIEQTGNWSSNSLLSFTNAQTLWGAVTSPEISFKNETGATQFIWTTRLDQNFFNRSKFNSTDIRTMPSLSYKGEKWDYKLSSRLDYDTTRTSEDTILGPEDRAIHRISMSASPQIAYRPTVLDTWALSGTITTSHYDSQSQTNYNTYAITPSFTHSFTPRSAGIINLQAQRYKTTRDEATRIDSIGPSVGWQTTLTPRTTASAFIGAQTSRQYNFGTAVSAWEWNYTFSGALAFKGKQDTIEFSAARKQYPYSDGTQALQTSFSINETHAINPSLSAILGALYQTSSYPIRNDSNIKTMIRGNAGMVYHATSTLDLTTKYQYRRKTLIVDNGAAQDHSVTIGLTLHPQAWSLTR